MNTKNSIKAKAIGARVKQRRLEANMTQEVVAALCGVSKKTLIKIEKGGEVYVSTLLTVLEMLGISFSLDVNNATVKDDDWF